MATDQLEREQENDSPEKKYDVANNLWQQETDFSDKVNKIYKNASEQSERGSSDVADDIDKAGGGVGGFIKNLNADTKDDDIADKESEGDDPSLFNGNGSEKEKRKFSSLVPTGGVVGLMLFAFIGVGGGSSLLASSILVNIKEVFHSDRADATRANNFFSRASLSSKLGSKSGTGCGTVAVKCKMSTFSKTQLRGYSDAGFKMEGDVLDSRGQPTGMSIEEYMRVNSEGGDPNDPSGSRRDLDANTRFRVSSITFPNGTKVTSGSSFHAHISANIKMRMRAVQAFNPRSSFYNNQKFSETLSRIGIAKSNAFDGRTRQELDDGFNNQTNGASEEDNLDEDRLNQRAAEREGELKAKVGKFADAVDGKVSGVVQVGCATYNISRAIVTGAKIERVIALIQFAYPWLQIADQIKNQGTVSSEKVDYMSSKATYFQSNKTITKIDPTQPDVPIGSPNPKYNLSLTDSQGYRVAAHKDKSKLTEFAKNYMVGGNGLLRTMDNTIDEVQNVAGFGDARTGRAAIRTACRAANSSVTEAAETIGCLVARATLVGGILCAAVSKGVEIAAQEALEALVKQFAPVIIRELAKMNLGSDTKGVDAGNALAAGAGLLLGTAATGYGLTPASDPEMAEEYIAYTDKLNNEYIEVAQYEARERPFDLTDKYSFLGSIAYSLNLQNIAGAPVLTSLTNIPRLFSTSILALNPQAQAVYSQPSLLDKDRVTQCNDPDLILTGIKAADKFCNIVAVLPTAELQTVEDQAADKNNSLDELIDWMRASKPNKEGDGNDSGTLDDTTGCDDDCREKSKLASIDDDGRPVPGSQYEKYLQNCTDQRINEGGAYWGTTAMSVEEGSNRDQEWATGAQCSHQSAMLRNFRAWTNYCLQEGTTGGALNCYEQGKSKTQNKSGDACSLMDNPNIVYVNEGTKTGLKELCEKGESVNSCGKPYKLDQELMDIVTTLSGKYKVWLNNFGFKYDRDSCDGGEHPKGKAVDLNGIEKLDGSGRAGGPDWGGITFNDSGQVRVVEEYAEDWLIGIARNHGGVGQMGCGGNAAQDRRGTAFTPAFPEGSINTNGSHFFRDSCDHLHIDVRDRGGGASAL